MAYTWTAYFKGATSRDQDRKAIAGIFNRETTDPRRTIDIREIRVFPSSPTSGTGMGTVSLQRITAMSGGVALTAVKPNAAVGDLPSQVSCVLFPDSITTSAKFRELCVNKPGLTPHGVVSTSPGNFMGARVANLESRVEAGLSAVFKAATGSVIQALRLAEGEGVAFVLDVEAQGQMAPFELWISDGSGNKYMFYDFDRSCLPMCPGQAAYAIFNASGSGVTLDVTVVRWPTIHWSPDQINQSSALESNWKSNLALAYCFNYRGGSLVTPVAHNPAADALIGIEAVQGPFNSLVFDGRSYGSDPAYSIMGVGNLFRHLMPGGFSRIEVGQVADPSPVKDHNLLFQARKGNVGLILRSGEGVAIYPTPNAAFIADTSWTGSVIAAFNVAITFVHNPPLASGVSRSRIFARS